MMTADELARALYGHIGNPKTFRCSAKLPSREHNPFFHGKKHPQPLLEGHYHWVDVWTLANRLPVPEILCQRGDVHIVVACVVEFTVLELPVL